MLTEKSSITRHQTCMHLEKCPCVCVCVCVCVCQNTQGTKHHQKEGDIQYLYLWGHFFFVPHERKDLVNHTY